MVNRPILAVASAGGHWVQLNRLLPAFEGLPVHFVTTTPLAGGTAPRAPGVSYVKDASRSDKPALVVLTLQLAWIVFKTRPAVVITTGAAPGLLALHLGKLVGARTIWIDSMANVDELSLSGAMARRCADLWLTQWPHLTERYTGLQHRGAVI